MCIYIYGGARLAPMPASAKRKPPSRGVRDVEAQASGAPNQGAKRSLMQNRRAKARSKKKVEIAIGIEIAVATVRAIVVIEGEPLWALECCGLFCSCWLHRRHKEENQPKCFESEGGFFISDASDRVCIYIYIYI